MARTFRNGIVVAMFGAGMLLAGAPAAPAGDFDSVIKVSKRQDGPYVEALQRNVDANSTKNAYIRVKNKADETDTVDLFGPDDASPYTFKYFRSNGENVTSDVAGGGGLSFDLKAGKAKFFRVKIKAGANTEGTCIAPNIIFNEGGDDSAVLGVNINSEVCT